MIRALAALLLLAAACGRPAETERPASESGLANTLRWSTRREVANAGFHVFRAESESGPFERLTDEAIPGAGFSSARREYLWEDRSIEPGREYFYYVESVTSSGKRVRVTPVIRASAKEADAAQAEENG